MASKGERSYAQKAASMNIRELAKLNQVLPRYMAGGHWNPGRKRMGSAKSRSR